MKLGLDKLRCTCNAWAEPTTLRIEGLGLSGWKCRSCGEEYLTPESSVRLSAYKHVQAHPSEATVTQVGNSLAIRIRKELVRALGLRKGEKLRVTLASPKKLELSVA